MMAIEAAPIRRRIAFPITNRTYYAHIHRLLQKLHSRREIDLRVMLGGAALLDKRSNDLFEEITACGIPIDSLSLTVIEGDCPAALAKTACLTALEFTNSLHHASPDVVVVCGEYCEQLPIAMSAAYLNKTIAHIDGDHGVDTLSNGVGGAVTKLSHIHFVTNDRAKHRLLMMGEDPRYVINAGCLKSDHAAASSSDDPDYLGMSASDIVVETLCTIELYTQKRFTDFRLVSPALKASTSAALTTSAAQPNM